MDRERPDILFKFWCRLLTTTISCNDTTVYWPAERPLIDLARILLTAPVAENARQQKKIIVDPILVSDGIDPSDPSLELRRLFAERTSSSAGFVVLKPKIVQDRLQKGSSRMRTVSLTGTKLSVVRSTLTLYGGDLI